MIYQLFSWCNEELTGLQNSKSVAIRDMLEDKEYKHIYHLFEPTYALAIKSRHNISGNPECECQLNYVGCYYNQIKIINH